MKLTYQEHPVFFEQLNKGDMLDFLEIDLIEEYRGPGSTFFRENIIEIKPEHQGNFGVVDIEPFFGIWRTNRWVIDAEYGSEGEPINALTKVAKKDTQVTVTKWVEI